jgi:2-polyprenyl-6-methoxyphenol hydroxylase-like FAD-dependent oxidoreductase
VNNARVLIAGGGIGGLALALTCDQIGVPFKLFESAGSIKPLGVGINIQPNAVRELFDLGLQGNLSPIGVKTREYGMFTKHGLKIWTEPRGTWGGYRWPQYSVHRGKLQMKLYQKLLQRAGNACIETGWRVEKFENRAEKVALHLINSTTGETRIETGALAVGADGIHSAIRAQMNPQEGPPIWGGAVLWRGTTLARPFRTGASMALIGHQTQRVVAYPISEADPKTGLATINWIAELTHNPEDGWNKEDWNREADKSEFIPRFMDWNFDWFDAPAVMSLADKVYEYPMVDRDPLEFWTQENVTLLGDAAHATYPVGSNGASQAIVDARKLGRALIDHGITREAFEAYEEEMRPSTTKLVLANRGSGPDAVLQLIEDRCGGQFDRLEDVATQVELAAHADAYKAIAGTAVEGLNTSRSTIAPGERI